MTEPHSGGLDDYRIAEGTGMTIRAQEDQDHARLAEQRADAALAVDQAVDCMQRAAVCLDTAVTRIRRCELPTEGCRLTLAASIDVLRDQIDFAGREREYLRHHAAEALEVGREGSAA